MPWLHPLQIIIGVPDGLLSIPSYLRSSAQVSCFGSGSSPCVTLELKKYMFITFVLNIIVIVVNFFFSFLPTVTSLPFGLESIMATVYGSYKGMTAIFPFLATGIQLALFAISIEMSYKVWQLITKIVGWIRGSG